MLGKMSSALRMIIRTDASLLRYSQRAATDTSFSTVVRDAHIDLKQSAVVSSRALRLLLLHALNITDLTLYFPHPAPTIDLEGIILPNLYLFNTNLPHNMLTTFLTPNLTICQLQLQGPGCGSSSVCPLDDVDLDGVDTLACHYSCLPYVVGPQVSALTVTLEGSSIPPSEFLFAAPARRRW